MIESGANKDLISLSPESVVLPLKSADLMLSSSDPMQSLRWNTRIFPCPLAYVYICITGFSRGQNGMESSPEDATSLLLRDHWSEIICFQCPAERQVVKESLFGLPNVQILKVQNSDRFDT